MSARWERKAGSPDWRFVPAPGWPPPPPGWSPSFGWQPDPAWPTPPGWRWIRRKRLPIVLVCVGFTVTALLVAAEIAAEANGHSIDPTDSMNYNYYALRNDSASRLYVRPCDDPRCTRLDRNFEWEPVGPGQAVTEQVYWGDPTPAVYAVSVSSDGTGKRCLSLDASKKAATTVDVPLSLAGGCGA